MFTLQLGQYMINISLSRQSYDMMRYCWIKFSFVILIRPNQASAQTDSVLNYLSKISMFSIIQFITANNITAEGRSSVQYSLTAHIGPQHRESSISFASRGPSEG